MERRIYLKYLGISVMGVAIAGTGIYYFGFKALSGSHPFNEEMIESIPLEEYVVFLVNDAVNLIQEKGQESFPEFRQNGGK